MTTKRYLIAATLIFTTMTLSACGPQFSKGLSGAGFGAAGGALLGQAIGRNTEATLIGMAAGTMVGYIVGNEMDKADRNALNTIYETGNSGQPRSWQNPDSGNSYTVTPQPAIQGQNGFCRRAEIMAVIDGQQERTLTTACRDQYGQWQIQ